MALDASIPLQVQQPNLAPLTDPRRIMGMQAAALELRQQQQNQQAQNALKALFSDPSNLDANGNPTPGAMNKIMAISPQVGMTLRNNMLKNEQTRLSMEVTKTDLFGKKLDMSHEVGNEALSAYEQAIANGTPEPQARSLAQQVYTSGLKKMEKSGLFSEQDLSQVNPAFDPNRIRGNAMTYAQWKDYQEKQKADQRANAELGIREKAEGRAETEFKQNQAGLGLSDAAKDEVARGYKLTGKLLPGMSRAEIADVVKRAGKMPNVVNPKELGQPIPVRITGKDGKPQTIEAVYDKSTSQWYTAQGHQPISGEVLPAKEIRDQEKQDASIISDDAAKLIADRVLAGDEKATTGMARSAQNIGKVSAAIAEEAKARGMDGTAIARKVAEFAGSVASERALGTRTANMEIAANEVKNMAPLALQLSEKVDRTKFPSLNSVILAAERGTGGEDVVRFGLATNSLIYMYAKFLNPNGIPTDADKARATDILSTAWAKGQFAAAVNQIQKEIQVGQEGLKTTKEEVGANVGKGGSKNDAGAPAPKSAKLPTVNSSADYDKLEPGDHYFAPDGKEYIKK